MQWDREELNLAVQQLQQRNRFRIEHQRHPEGGEQIAITRRFAPYRVDPKSQAIVAEVVLLERFVDASTAELVLPSLVLRFDILAARVALWDVAVATRLLPNGTEGVLDLAARFPVLPEAPA